MKNINLGNPGPSDRMRMNNQGLLKERIEKAGCSSNRFANVGDWYSMGLARQIRSATLDGMNVSLEEMDIGSAIRKASIVSTDTGVLNALYTMGSFIQYATMKSAFGVIPKQPWNEQGFRAVIEASKTSNLGIAEAQPLGASVKPIWTEVAPTVKEWELVQDYSSRMGVYSDIADAVAIEDGRVVHEADFFRSMNADLMKDNDTLAGLNVESLDRVIASNSELACGMGAGDLDIYGIDRDAGPSWADAYVNHNGGVARNFTVELVNSLFTNVYEYWDNPTVQNKVYITGMDTLQKWGEAEVARYRWNDAVPVQITVGDGIKTLPGMVQTGMILSTYQGIPVIPDTTIAQDTLSRVYLTDMDNLALMTGIPIAFYESDDMFQVGHLTKGVWYGAGELYAKKFRPHGKLRDLQ